MPAEKALSSFAPNTISYLPVCRARSGLGVKDLAASGLGATFFFPGFAEVLEEGALLWHDYAVECYPRSVLVVAGGQGSVRLLECFALGTVEARFDGSEIEASGLSAFFGSRSKVGLAIGRLDTFVVGDMFDGVGIVSDATLLP